ncbi:N-6 DNA methylase (plasmid) [Halarchaeum sp. CBA1220]|uniref:Eco57I restriction-modification methylase domain-containing protein n=1 Tax=Halarchaeum sp. CBA1220 TaxID=1853682 RepID=UPI000F3A866B|nr:TaqI-like C-terminal specificity domain-containing protein [Halarchaeum sp. CBA1220]QLC35681.1 N-6 DNA methylase [Halarchaeum sp. CBA1220]
MTDPTTYRTNRDLFSNHYLSDHLRKTEPWESVDADEVQEAYDDIEELWEEKRDRVSDYNEAQLERNFIRPVFDILGVPFEIEETVQRGARRPDYGFFETEAAADGAFDRGDFYEEAIAVADAKRWGRKLDTRGEEKRDYENPSYQIHDYLEKTPVQWAVLTNGAQWRLYYGPTSHRLDSYYEIDLPELLADVASGEAGMQEFKEFYCFFRREAFVPDSSGDCFLDDVYDESSVFAEALGEDLQDNIYEAIRVLAEGFLESNDDLDAEDLDLVHDSSLIYLYRLIFVLYAESEGRDLLPTENDIYADSYSLNDLKRRVVSNRNATGQQYQSWQTNLWGTLDELFELIDQGSKGMGIDPKHLYIPAYNGGLFRTNPEPDDSAEARFLSQHEVGDTYLAEVIALLTEREADEGEGTVFVDYSSLDERHLGSIYEGLLEYELAVAPEDLTLSEGEYVAAEAGDGVAVPEGDVYLRTDAGERKATGSYYTPEYVVEYIVDETLGPLVDDIREDLLAQDPFGKEGGSQFAEDFAERVFDLKVLDPAMGSGHFLVNAVDYLAREIIDAQERQDQQAVEAGEEERISDPVTEEGELRDINWARRKVAQQCLYGVDLNPLATELAKVSLWLRTLAAEQPLAFLDHHLKTGNSLVGSDIEDVLGESENSDSGQLTLQQSFDHTRQQALEHVMERFTDLLSIDNETLADIKEMEEVYEDVREDPLYQHLLAMANVHTASEFGLDVPENAEEQMAEALRDDSWDDVAGEDWFRSAQAMADEEAFFHWELEFPVAFYGEDGERLEDAGFDAVIGNPPYVETSGILDEYLRSSYQVTEYFVDYFHAFIEQGVKKLRVGGEFGYIVPAPWLTIENKTKLREFTLENTRVEEIATFSALVFPDATVDTVILHLKKDTDPEEILVSELDNSTPTIEKREVKKLSQKTILETDSKRIDTTTTREETNILERIKSVSIDLKEIAELSIGVQAYNSSKHTKEQIDNRVFHATEKVDTDYLPQISGKDVSRYEVSFDGNTWIKYGTHLHDYRDKRFLTGPRILVRQIPSEGRYRIQAAFTDQTFCNYNTVLNILVEDERYPEKYILALLNSSLVSWVFPRISNSVVTDSFPKLSVVDLEKIPIRELSEDAKSINNSPELLDRIRSWKGWNSSDEPAQPTIPNDPSYAELLPELSGTLSNWVDSRHALNLNLLDYLGNYTEGPNLPNVGLFQPTSSNILDATTEDYDKLQVENVRTKRDGHSVTIEATARYKPEDEDEFETDTWGYTETDYVEAFTLADLADEEAALVEAFVPVAVDEEIGGFRDNATKTNSLIDRLKAITLPDIDDVAADLERYIETKERADELDAKIEKTDRLIDEIVYDLYDLDEEEIAIVEEAVGDE